MHNGASSEGLRRENGKMWPSVSEQGIITSATSPDKAAVPHPIQLPHSDIESPENASNGNQESLPSHEPLEVELGPEVLNMIGDVRTFLDLVSEVECSAVMCCSYLEAKSQL